METFCCRVHVQPIDCISFFFREDKDDLDDLDKLLQSCNTKKESKQTSESQETSTTTSVLRPAVKPPIAKKPTVKPRTPAFIPGNANNKPTPSPRRQAPAPDDRPIPQPRQAPSASSPSTDTHHMTSADILQYIQQEEEDSSSTDLFAD